MPSWTSPRRVPTAGCLAAEGQLAGRGDLEPHLLLDVGDVDAVALAELTGLEVDVVLRQDEQGQALGAGTGALGAGEDEVDDVVDHVGLAAGDEALDAGEGPGAVLVLDGLGAAGADVGPGVGLGEHHRAVPALLDDPARPASSGPRCRARGGAWRRRRPAANIAIGRVGAEEHLVDGPAQARRGDGAVELRREVDGPEATLAVGLERLAERLGHRTDWVLRVVDRRVAVGVGERLGELVLRQPRDLLSISRAVSASTSAYGPEPSTSPRPSTSKRLNSMSRRLLL